ncbi:MAG: hypothetical protein ACRCS3_09005 [Paracoccaceae bacterium]
MARHDAAGQPKDPHAKHRQDLILQRRAARRQALLAVLRKAGLVLRSLVPLLPGRHSQRGRLRAGKDPEDAVMC